MKKVSITCNRCGKDISIEHVNSYDVEETTTFASKFFGDLHLDFCDDCNGIFTNEFVRGYQHE